jgi:hypothetical protein
VSAAKTCSPAQPSQSLSRFDAGDLMACAVLGWCVGLITAAVLLRIAGYFP